MAYVFETESEDMDVMLADSMHTIAWNGVLRPCFYDIMSETGIEPGGASAQVLEMETAGVKDTDFPGLKEGDAVSISEINGWTQNYTVIQASRNGCMKDLILQRIS